MDNKTYETLSRDEKWALEQQVKEIDPFTVGFYKSKVVVYIQMKKYLKLHHPYKNVRNFIRGIMSTEYNTQVDNLTLHLVTKLYDECY